MSLTSDASSPRSYVSPRISTPQTNAGAHKPLLSTQPVISQPKVRHKNCIQQAYALASRVGKEDSWINFSPRTVSYKWTFFQYCMVSWMKDALMNAWKEYILNTWKLLSAESICFWCSVSNLLCLGEHGIGEAGVSPPAHIPAAPHQR